MLLFIPLVSPVVIYAFIFQYIPCYCLSDYAETFSSIFVEFQYIPCYCLSYTQLTYCRRNDNFNTSHVTVYHIDCNKAEIFIRISIHPMLLFITFFMLRTFMAFNFNTSHVTVYLFDYMNLLAT